MPAVLVHGVPETHHVWDDLRAHLSRVHSVAVALPGFGNAMPAGFGATMNEYATWLIAELEAVGEPVDLVGHDWGGILTLRVASVRPDLVTRWVTDAPGAFDESFSWFVPDKDDEVLIVFEGGDPRRPYVIGGLWNGSDSPPESMDGSGKNAKKVLRSRNGVKITLDGDRDTHNRMRPLRGG